MKGKRADTGYLPRGPFEVRIGRFRSPGEHVSKHEVLAHVFDNDSIAAVNGALAAERPLLVRGEPGVGKTQLAAAAAAKLQRPLASFTVNSRTEPSDLLWRFDAVQRLAEAQICGTERVNVEQARLRLAEWRFVHPGPLWWGFAWDQALDHIRRIREGSSASDGRDKNDAHIRTDFKPDDHVPDRSGDPANGVVVLIDEIDKADSDLPNGLLEALGARQFTPNVPGCNRVVAGFPPPLVVITTNQERVLPDAFVRRCLILHLQPPGLQDLIARGRAHFPNAEERLLESVARQLLDDRENMPPPLPGLAEYLDLLRAAFTLKDVQGRNIDELINELKQFTLRKHSGGHR